MDRSNRRNVEKISAWKPALRARIHMFREFDPQGPGEVPDPYYGGSEGFERVYEMLHRTCSSFLESIKVPEG
jgi:protein-tyrosine phosphatase